jgi:hypothetical protein
MRGASFIIQARATVRKACIVRVAYRHIRTPLSRGTAPLGRLPAGSRSAQSVNSLSRRATITYSMTRRPPRVGNVSPPDRHASRRASRVAPRWPARPQLLRSRGTGYPRATRCAATRTRDRGITFYTIVAGPLSSGQPCSSRLCHELRAPGGGAVFAPRVTLFRSQRHRYLRHHVLLRPTRCSSAAPIAV